VNGLSEIQNNKFDQSQILQPDSLPKYPSPKKNNSKNRMAYDYNYKKQSKFDDDVQMISNILKSKKNKTNNIKESSKQKCKKLNKFFIQTQFNDSYRDVMTAFNILSPNQKSLFNLQSLPVTTTYYDPNKPIPQEFIKLVTQFINTLNKTIQSLPDSVEIINDYNNYLPLTSQMKKYVEDKGINKFYKEIGVDFNLYPDTPVNSPVELIKIIRMSREFTEAENKYVITFVLKKIIDSVTDQIKITVNFITKNDPTEYHNLFDTGQVNNVNAIQQVAIEFIFTDGFYTNDFNVDYDCYGGSNKQVANNDGDDNFYSYADLGKNNLVSENAIITELNKKLREHEIEMDNFNVNIPYPVYQHQK
jgi:hypothetical protein